ncbi:MAG: hypothetical protein Alpg2KO_28660 [Alphaproteobacteria bacterium]
MRLEKIGITCYYLTVLPDTKFRYVWNPGQQVPFRVNELNQKNSANTYVRLSSRSVARPAVVGLELS